MTKYILNNTNKIILAVGLVLTGIFFQVNSFSILKETAFRNKTQDFFTIFLSLLVEATPFVLIGVTVSVIVALYFKEEYLLNLLPKNFFVSHLLLSVMGIFMPVCECGNVPVLRRLLLKGFKVSHGITFLLAAPIVNPVTLWATYEAFGGNWTIVIVRAIGALFIANIVGWLFSIYKKEEDLLTKDFYEEVCDHDHDHSENKLDKALDIFQDEFITITKSLILGAFIASIFQSFIPRATILELGQDPLLSIIAMIIFSFIISICANVDAFYAISFRSTFTLGSLVSFMVFGPMVDIKMLTMLSTTFKIRFLILMSALVFVLSIIIGLLFNLLY